MEISIENLDAPTEAPEPSVTEEIPEQIPEIQKEIPEMPELIREPKRRGRPKSAPKPKAEPKQRGRPKKVTVLEEHQVEYIPPTADQLHAYVTPLLQAYASHLQMNQ